MEAVAAGAAAILGELTLKAVFEEGIRRFKEHYSDKEVQIASSLNTNLVLTVKDASCADCADVILENNRKADNQIWIIRGSKTFPFCVQIVNKHSGRCLNFTGGKSVGGHVGQYHASLCDPMIQFFVMPYKGFNLLVINPGDQRRNQMPKYYVLDVPGANAHAGAKLQQWELNGTDAQCFKITYL